MNADQIVEAAVKQSGVFGFEDGSFREGLNVLERNMPKGGATPEGFALMQRMMVDALATRFQVEDYLRDHPELLQRPITAPVCVLGLPRTGTTMTVNLLIQDPSRRAPLKWELSEPIPPAAAGQLKTDPRCVAKKDVQKRRVASGELQANIHFEWADEPTECVFIHMQDFKSAGWDTFLPMPEYSEFLLSCDMEPTYRWHKRELQALQHHNGGRWLSKAPSHALFAEALLKVYPDAKLIWTHRDPLIAVPSLISLSMNVEKRFRADADMDWICKFYPYQLAEHARRMLAIEKKYPGQVYNVMYNDVMRKPVETMRGVYKWLGEDFSPAIENGITSWLAANPQGKHGGHSYGLEEYGIPKKRVIELFEPYMQRFGFLQSA